MKAAPTAESGADMLPVTLAWHGAQNSLICT